MNSQLKIANITDVAALLSLHKVSIFGDIVLDFFFRFLLTGLGFSNNFERSGFSGSFLISFPNGGYELLCTCMCRFWVWARKVLD